MILTLLIATEIAVMATMGGITSVLQGGKFGHGFVSAGLSAIGGQFIKGANWIKKGVGKTVAKITLGGTISKITGGKFANGAAGAAFAMVVQSVGEGVKRLHSGPGGTESNVTKEDVLERWETLRKTPEIAAIEKRLGQALKVTVSKTGVTGYKDGAIHFNLTDLSVGYKTVLPNNWEAQFEHLHGDAYFDALDNFEANYPKYNRFSVERILTHEAFHAFDGAPTGLKYQLNQKFYEQPVINRTNEFMMRNYGEPYRLDHGNWRVMQ